MTAELIGFYGCERGGYLDLWNSPRTLAYVFAHSPTALRVNRDCVPDISEWMPDPFQILQEDGSLLLSESGGALLLQSQPADGFLTTEADDGLTQENGGELLLNQLDTPVDLIPNISGPFTNPIDDGAWWWDPNRPESAAFLGMQVTKLSGLTANTISVNTFPTARCDNAIGYEPPVSNGYTLTFEAVLHGLTCCSVAYGLRRLRKFLAGCCGESACSGTRLRILSCLPSDADVCATWLPPTETTSPWRTLVNVKMTEQPAVVESSGISCGACGCAPLTKIMFTVRANAEMFLDAFKFLPETALTSGIGNCTLTPCETPVCVEPSDFLDDPSCASPILLPPADTAVSCFCPPLFRAEQWFTVDLDARVFDSDLEVIVHAGSQQLQNLEVLIWPQFASLDHTSGFYTDCNPCNGFTVSYVPQGSELHRDMCGVRVLQPGKSPVNGASVFAGISGRFHDPCLRLPSCKYLVCIRTDGSSTAPDATIEILAHEVEP